MKLRIKANSHLKFIWKWQAGTEESPHLLGVFEGSKQIGLVKWEAGWGSSEGVCWLYDVKLDPEFQGLGIGKQAYLEAFNHLRERYFWATSAIPITNDALRVWKSLERDGKAQQILLYGEDLAYGVKLQEGPVPESIVIQK